MDMAVIVLAGGEGRRIGGAKPLRLLGGDRLVDRAIAFARRFSNHVALSVGAGSELPDCPIPQIVDPEPGWGALAGVAAGLDFAAGLGLETLLTLPCDSPFLPDDLAERLVAALQPEHGAAIPGSGGRLHPACGLWRTCLRGLLADYAAGGGRSLHGFAERAGFVEVDWPSRPIDPFFNINHPNQLARAEVMLAELTPKHRPGFPR